MNIIHTAYAAWPAVAMVLQVASVRRMTARHKASLKQMQTALWNDRQLRIGRTPSTNSGVTVPIKVDTDV